MTVPHRNQTLFWNAIVEINAINNINIYHSIATIVCYKHGKESSSKVDPFPKKDASVFEE